MKPEPTGVERHLGIDDVIVTKTDLKGRITYANDVFCDICAMTEVDLLGQPHNVIRHPEMPRGVFHLLWSTVTRGHEIFAYVVNLAADGAHYWVLAHVTPSFDATGRVVGYHSSRRKADAAVVAQLRPLYRRLLDEEARHTRAGDAAEAGVTLLQRILDEQGLTYERFIWDLTNGVAA
ncbi:PAS domain-containing protein [Nocardioides caricicola]|uniref:PAS domain-containing protein n=1 Tax=Nocardioides caricicola TaxID=634770 RepID=A0ABW0MYL6_9ACTN